MKHVYINRIGDREKIIEYKSDLEKLSNRKLIDRYNSLAKVGIVGVHQQVLLIIALHQLFLKRFKKSPILVENNIIISLKGEIRYVSNIDSFINYFGCELN